jgi:hypothetical protein
MPLSNLNLISSPTVNHEYVIASRLYPSTTTEMADAQINHQDARAYWQSIDADVNGMLGGFPYISRVDLQGSKSFLAKLGVGGRGKKKIGRAVDCGAG